MKTSLHLTQLLHLEEAAVCRNGFADPNQCRPEILKDLEEAKLFKNVGTPERPLVHLTIDGWKETSLLRQHLGSGGTVENYAR